MENRRKVLITGGTGMVGQRLTPLLQAAGYQVAWLGRSGRAPEGITGYQWNPAQGTIAPEALAGTYAVVHLAGAGVADKRWSAARKKVILESRTQTTALLRKEIAKQSQKPEIFVSASAIGYYGLDTGNTLLHENAPAGHDFLADVVKAWEHEIQQICSEVHRVTMLRIGVVLANEGGALPKLMGPVKYGVGAPLGSGRQFVSWIHIEDLVRMLLFLLESDQISGPINGVSPNPATNRDLTRKIAGALQKPLWLPPVPGFVLRLALGEMAGIVLGGNKVSAATWADTPFIFNYPELDTALQDLLDSGTT